MSQTTKIVTTIGPASNNAEVMSFFASHGVAIARLNFSHGSAETHRVSANLARENGLELLFDLPGPKIRLGEVSQNLIIKTGDLIVLENQEAEQEYPYSNAKNQQVFPFQFPINKFVQPDHKILVDDGKLELKVAEIVGEKVICEVVFGGVVKSKKGLNMPNSKLEVPFLGERDIMMLNALLVELKPEIVAASFVKTKFEILELKELLTKILSEAGVTDYFPRICPKLEMAEAVSDVNLPEIVAESDLIMIARGDLALETEPANILVPFLQEKIVKECQKQGKKFIVATQALETMCDFPVPTRAEVSDLYRSVVIDKADYVMLSGESAAGNFPMKAVEVMDDLIKMANNG
jgi:pyruvate kinase